MYRSKIIRFSFLLMLSIHLYSCKTEKQEETPSQSDVSYFKDPYPVEIALTQVGDFEIALSFRGKLEAARSTTMRFPSSGTIEELNITNGDYVRKGEILAKLNDEKEQINFKKAKNRLRNADLTKEYTKIGYAPSGGEISEKAMDAINLQSGYTEALLAIEEAELLLRNRTIRAPFYGKIVDLKARQFENSDDHAFFCRIIDPHTLIAKFSIVEEEIRSVLTSDKVSAYSPILPDVRYETNKFNINPVVNENGFSEVMAEFEVDNNQLWEGMSVNINAIKNFRNTLSIPKTAVVKRNDEDVVFTYVNGVAKWNYVELGKQNENYWSIKEGLNPSDTVIVSGNLNLADGVPVTIKDRRS